MRALWGSECWDRRTRQCSGHFLVWISVLNGKINLNNLLHAFLFLYIWKYMHMKGCIFQAIEHIKMWYNIQYSVANAPCYLQGWHCASHRSPWREAMEKQLNGRSAHVCRSQHKHCPRYFYDRYFLHNHYNLPGRVCLVMKGLIYF